MPSRTKLQEEANSYGEDPRRFDIIRSKYIRALHEYTDRNVIIYYSGWLYRSLEKLSQYSIISDLDKNAFMSTIYGLDKTKGLDLILHTPGGEIAATESIVDYLHSMFSDIRAIVPQLAMSGGTLIALSCNSIIMGKQSSLGPIDPQLHGIAAHGVIEEFKQASKEIKKDPDLVPLWRQIISQYPPTFIGSCQKAIKWSDEIAYSWLSKGMCKDDKDDKRIKKILKELGDHALTKSHARHLSASKCREMGLNISMMEDDQKLQDLILSVHHTAMMTLVAQRVYKIVENQNGMGVFQGSPPQKGSQGSPPQKGSQGSPPQKGSQGSPPQK